MREERADRTDMVDTTDECCDRDAVEILGWHAAVGPDARMRDAQTASRVRQIIHADSHQHDDVPRSQERRNPAESCDTRVR